jgi:hypothetical protein
MARAQFLSALQASDFCFMPIQGPARNALAPGYLLAAPAGATLCPHLRRYFFLTAPSALLQRTTSIAMSCCPEITNSAGGNSISNTGDKTVGV